MNRYEHLGEKRAFLNHMVEKNNFFSFLTATAKVQWAMALAPIVPGPVFGYLMISGMADGAQYFYRFFRDTSSDDMHLPESWEKNVSFSFLEKNILYDTPRVVIGAYRTLRGTAAEDANEIKA